MRPTASRHPKTREAKIIFCKRPACVVDIVTKTTYSPFHKERATYYYLQTTFPERSVCIGDIRDVRLLIEELQTLCNAEKKGGRQ